MSLNKHTRSENDSKNPLFIHPSKIFRHRASPVCELAQLAAAFGLLNGADGQPHGPANRPSHPGHQSDDGPGLSPPPLRHFQPAGQRPVIVMTMAALRTTRRLLRRLYSLGNLNLIGLQHLVEDSWYTIEDTGGGT